MVYRYQLKYGVEAEGGNVELSEDVSFMIRNSEINENAVITNSIRSSITSRFNKLNLIIMKINILQTKALEWWNEKGLMTQHELTDAHINSKNPKNISIQEVIFMYEKEQLEDSYIGKNFMYRNDNEILYNIKGIENGFIVLSWLGKDGIMVDDYRGFTVESMIDSFKDGRWIISNENEPIIIADTNVPVKRSFSYDELVDFSSWYSNMSKDAVKRQIERYFTKGLR